MEEYITVRNDGTEAESTSPVGRILRGENRRTEANLQRETFINNRTVKHDGGSVEGFRR